MFKITFDYQIHNNIEWLTTSVIFAIDLNGLSDVFKMNYTIVFTCINLNCLFIVTIISIPIWHWSNYQVPIYLNGNIIINKNNCW